VNRTLLLFPVILSGKILEKAIFELQKGNIPAATNKIAIAINKLQFLKGFSTKIDQEIWEFVFTLFLQTMRTIVTIPTENGFPVYFEDFITFVSLTPFRVLRNHVSFKTATHLHVGTDKSLP
jgi:hypothetical protein